MATPPKSVSWDVPLTYRVYMRPVWIRLFRPGVLLAILALSIVPALLDQLSQWNDFGDWSFLGLVTSTLITYIFALLAVITVTAGLNAVRAHRFRGRTQTFTATHTKLTLQTNGLTITLERADVTQCTWTKLGLIIVSAAGRWLVQIPSTERASIEPQLRNMGWGSAT